MQNAPVGATELNCQCCGRPLIENGKFKCHRCGRETEMVLGEKAIFCHYCRKPRILLAKHDLALCYKCRKETPMIQKEEKMNKDLVAGAYPLPRGLGKNPKKAFEIVSRLENTKEKVFDKLFKEYFEKAFTCDGRGYNEAMVGEVSEIFGIGYRKPLKVNLKAFESGGIGHTEYMIAGEAFWGDPEKEKDLPSWKKSESEKFIWISIYREEDAIAYAQQAKKFFTDLGIKVSLKMEF